MTEPTKPAALSQEGMESALADVEALRELLLQLGQGQKDAGDVQGALNKLWTEHGDALSASAAVLGEQVRQQLLAQLLGWRAQLDSQLGGQRTSDGP